MLQRFLFIAALVVLLITVMGGSFGPSLETHTNMQIEKVGGRPYLLLESLSSESTQGKPELRVYTLAGKSFDEWDAVIAERTGPTLGMFVTRVPREVKPAPASPAISATEPAPPPAATEQPAQFDERLGLFFRDSVRETTSRALLLDVTERPAATNALPMSVRWPPETAAELNGVTYAFGVNTELPPKESGGKRHEGILKAAKFDGKKWEELPADGPRVSFPIGFTLRAVEHNGKLRAFWRDMESDELLGDQVEGPRHVSTGTVSMAGFDGKQFDAAVQAIEGLPRGNASIWSADGQIKFLVQSRLKLEDSIYTNGALEIYGVRAGEKDAPAAATLLETVVDAQPKSNLLPFIAAQHVVWEGQEHILRSNWQMFEVWRKSSDGVWTLALRNPRGLPHYNLEAVLLGTLLVCLGMIAFGAGMAYRRRKQMLASNIRIHAREIYASLNLRMGAYALDLFLVCLLAMLAGRLLRGPFISPLTMLPTDLFKLPDTTFFVVYMAYMAGAESLFGATAGKFVMGLRVVSDSGLTCSLWSAFVRNLLGFYERLPQTALFVPLPMILITPRRQRLGDLLARTFVIHKSALDAYRLQRARDLAKAQTEQQTNEQKDTDSGLPAPDSVSGDDKKDPPGGGGKKD
jgi:uncharacterized RDD family membrane protein YckC